MFMQNEENSFSSFVFERARVSLSCIQTHMKRRFLGFFFSLLPHLVGSFFWSENKQEKTKTQGGALNQPINMIYFCSIAPIISIWTPGVNCDQTSLFFFLLQRSKD